MRSLKIGERNFDIYSDECPGWEDNALVDLKLFSCFLSGGTVLDIGVNVGLATIYFAQ